MSLCKILEYLFSHLACRLCYELLMLTCFFENNQFIKNIDKRQLFLDLNVFNERCLNCVLQIYEKHALYISNTGNIILVNVVPFFYLPVCLPFNVLKYSL